MAGQLRTATTTTHDAESSAQRDGAFCTVPRPAAHSSLPCFRCAPSVGAVSPSSFCVGILRVTNERAPPPASHGPARGSGNGENARTDGGRGGSEHTLPHCIPRAVATARFRFFFLSLFPSSLSFFPSFSFCAFLLFRCSVPPPLLAPTDLRCVAAVVAAELQYGPPRLQMARCPPGLAIAAERRSVRGRRRHVRHTRMYVSSDPAASAVQGPAVVAARGGMSVAGLIAIGRSKRRPKPRLPSCAEHSADRAFCPPEIERTGLAQRAAAKTAKATPCPDTCIADRALRLAQGFAIALCESYMCAQCG